MAHRSIAKLYWASHGGNTYLVGSVLASGALMLFAGSGILLPTWAGTSSTSAAVAAMVVLALLGASTLYSPALDYDQLLTTTPLKVRRAHPSVVYVVTLLFAFAAGGLSGAGFADGVTAARTTLFWLGWTFLFTALRLGGLVWMGPLVIFLALTYGGYDSVGDPLVWNPLNRGATDAHAWWLVLPVGVLGLGGATLRIAR